MINHYMNLRHILLCLCLLAGITASAYDAEIDGIYYNFSGDEAEVTYQKKQNYDYISDYSGDIVIPEAVTYDGKTYSVTSIGEHAFAYSKLTSVIIPDCVTSIGHAAFWWCGSLTSINIPKGVTSIDQYTCGACPKLASIVVDENNPIYDSRDGCNAIIETATNTLVIGSVNTIIPNTITSIGVGAFNTSRWNSGIIPNSVKAIGDEAFYQTSGITSLNFPNSVTSIGLICCRCHDLTSVTIPESVTSIRGSYWYDNAFTDCDKLNSIIVLEGNSIYDSRNGCNAIIETATNKLITGCKSTIIPEDVTSIGRGAFFGCDGITSIAIPEGVGEIGRAAFQWCGNLTSINIPNGVRRIENETFDGCRSLTSIIIPAVNYIGSEAFSDCSRLTSVTVKLNTPVTIEENTFTNRSNATLYVPIGSKAAYEAADYWKEFKEIIETDLLVPENVEISGIYYCIDKERKVAEVIPSPDDNLYSGNITIPSSVTYDGETYSVTGVGYKAFRGCTELTSITIPNSVTYISEAAFLGCSDLTSVNIPNSVNSIDEGAFSECVNLKNISIPNSVTYIGDKAFYLCESLTSVTIPNSVTSIGEQTFVGCSSLTSVTIPNSVTSIGEQTFVGCSSLNSVIIGNGVTSIGSFAFMGCSSLTSITIPNSVETIGSTVFIGCNLSSVTIGSGVKHIDELAFVSCGNLADVYCLAESVPETNNEYGGIFDGSNIENATLHVPASALEAYKTTKPWSDFGAFEAIVTRCATPTIGYANGKLTFKCETEGVTFIYNIKDDDIKYGAGNEVDLCVAYQISVYATKGGIANSNVATATLCWVDQQPEAEGLTDEDAVLEMKALPVLIQTQGSTITVQGAANGTQIYVYATDGMQQATAIAVGGGATLNTSLQPGSVAIVKIGERTIKVLMK